MDAPTKLESRKLWTERLIFVLGAFLLSRLIIAAAMGIVAPALPAPEGGVQPSVGMHELLWWDAGWYRYVADHGYVQPTDNHQSPIAFLPLYPLTVRGLMRATGMDYRFAGPLVNNLFFLAALLILYLWTEQSHGRREAQWATAAMAFCPYALFTATAYTEGLFMACSGAALWAFHNRRHGLAALFGSLASVTRVTGAMLAPAFLLTAFLQKRGLRAYAFACLAGAGLAAHMLYCLLAHGDPLAFVHAQAGWRSGLGFDWAGWAHIIVNGLTGPIQWEIYPPAGGFIIVLMVFGAAALFIKLRKELDLAALIYGVLSLLIIFSSGSIRSVDRYVFAILPFHLGLGIIFARNRGWGWTVLLYCALLLGAFAVRFAQRLWVA